MLVLESYKPYRYPSAVFTQRYLVRKRARCQIWGTGSISGDGAGDAARYQVFRIAGHAEKEMPDPRL